jgi:ankyrin repeat protein
VGAGDETELHVAASTGDLDRLRALIADLAKVRERDKGRFTPLHRAVEAGQVEAARVLLAAGADVNAVGDSGTALSLAAARGDVAMVEMLLEHEADPNLAGTDDGADLPIHELIEGEVSRMYRSAAEGVPECLAALVRAGADLEAADHHGNTALAHALRMQLCFNEVKEAEARGEFIKSDLKKGMALAVQFLALGANPNCEVCGDGVVRTALSVVAAAVYDERAAVLAQLVAAPGVLVRARDCNGRIALHAGMTSGSQHGDRMRILMDAGADPNARDGTGKAPLHLVEDKSDVKALNLAGADPDPRDQVGMTPLLYAVGRSSPHRSSTR